MENYNRGSEWRRWDLHVHTPETNKNDNYKGCSSKEKWNNFYAKINEYIGDGLNPLHNIVAIGITDYLSIDNYKKVLQDRRLPDSVKLIVPNVELRIMPLAKKSPVNIHCIFNPEKIDILENTFFANLKIEYANNTYNATRSDLIRYGKDLKGTRTRISDEIAYKEGVNKFIISVDNLMAIFKNNKELRENTLIAISNNSDDGASGITTHKEYIGNAESQLASVRTNIYLNADFIFSGNDSDVKYFLGKGADSKAAIIQKYGSLKACVHGSDAHDLERLFEPVGGKYCWIKADPTFNGLCQILYEPEQRVRISSNVPDEKDSYHVIDNIQLNQEDFLEEPIFFNPQLNCIIGGKSTGKSILLHNIAYAIDSEQALNKSKLCSNKPLDLEKAVVTWCDGSSSNSNEKDENHKIIYIPQTYLNRLTDSEDDKTDIDSIIENVLMQYQKNKNLRDELLNQIAEIRRITDNDVLRLMHDIEKYKEKQDMKKELGTKEGIYKQLEALQLRKKQMNFGDTITEEEQTEYNIMLENMSSMRLNMQVMENDLKIIKGINQIFTKALIPSGLSENTYTILKNIQNEQEKKIMVLWNSERDKLLEKINANQNKVHEELVNIQKNFNELSKKVTANDEMIKLSNKIQVQNDRIRQYDGLEKECQNIKDCINDHIDKLSNTLISYQERYIAYTQTINKFLNDDKNDEHLNFCLRTKFKKNAYLEKVYAVFDNRSLRQFKDIFDEEDFDFNKLSKENIQCLIKAILTKKLSCKGAFDISNALNEMLSNYFFVSYDVSMDNDSMSSMSPGKKALVLLELLINLDQSKCPILIDQPEDDLDNRSIFNELIPFIRAKKTQRQIIIVTHNANVVLGGDAEEVIVANQDGKDIPNGTKRFEYRSGSIENNHPQVDENGRLIPGILNTEGIQQHICDILEGGKIAFELRKNKYHMD